MNRYFSIGLFVTFAAVVWFGEERPGAARQETTPQDTRVAESAG
jgi:hypothetical protein